MDPILSVLCNEPEGDVMRSVYPMELSIENLDKFYKAASQHKTLFNNDIRGSFRSFVESFLIQRPGSTDPTDVIPTGLMWVIDDFVGVFYITDIRPAREAIAHYSFFDGRHRGRQDLAIEILNYVFDRYKFRRLTAEVAVYAGKYVAPFITNLGFKYEGRKRSCIPYGDRWYDSLIYGLLSEELWARRSSRLEAVQLQD